MAKELKIVIAQLNLTVGDIQGNLAAMKQAAQTARDTMHADMIVFPELSITGYPPEDLLLRKAFIDAATQAFNQFKNEIQNIYCVVGHPYLTSQGLFNCSSVVYNGTILGRYAKQHLPNYGVFDEYRYFVPGNSPCIVPIHGIPVGIVICEDIWHTGPTQQIANHGARLIIAPNASPFELDKHEQRHVTLAKRAKTANVPILYVNNVGGQDEIVFDGGSMLIDQDGKICQHAGFFNETLHLCEMQISSTQTTIPAQAFNSPSEEQRIYDALVLGTRDYIRKNGFPGALIGVSGGIDSALTLTIAVDALGKENVYGVLLPSRYTSHESVRDAMAVINNFGVAHETISIEPTFSGFLQSLAPLFGDKKPDITEENLQSRCRGVILMALSNQTGKLVLTTCNRSEVAVGYSTLYGDMAGGFNVLKDVPKMLVYRLAKYRNQLSPVIPQNTIERAPTAELAPNQKDEDTLPPYPILDKILELYLNQEQSVDDIVALGLDRATVTRVVNMIHKNEYKRRQGAIGPRINHKSFGRDWRYPVTSGYKA